jgi:hypothetical protein
MSTFGDDYTQIDDVLDTQGSLFMLFCLQTKRAVREDLYGTFCRGKDNFYLFE